MTKGKLFVQFFCGKKDKKKTDFMGSELETFGTGSLTLLKVWDDDIIQIPYTIIHH